jgi:hypothetical protein
MVVSLVETDAVVAKVGDFGTSKQLFIDAFKDQSNNRAVQLPTWLSPGFYIGEFLKLCRSSGRG